MLSGNRKRRLFDSVLNQVSPSSSKEFKSLRSSLEENNINKRVKLCRRRQYPPLGKCEKVKKSPQHFTAVERLVPNRTKFRPDLAQLQPAKRIPNQDNVYEAVFQNSLLNLGIESHALSILGFRSPGKLARFDPLNASSLNVDDIDPFQYDLCKFGVAKSAKPLVAPRFLDKPFKTLRSPEIIEDDSILKFMDWSKKDQIAIASKQSVFLSTDSVVDELSVFSSTNKYVSAVKYPDFDSSILAVGQSNGQISIWDVQTLTKIRTLVGHHQSRVSALDWNAAKNVLTSAGKDFHLYNHDLRVCQNVILDFALGGHNAEVSNMTWNGTSLATSGADLHVCIWEMGYGKSRLRLQAQHHASKGLTWCPHQRNLLASGGSNPKDRTNTMKIWSTTSGNPMSSTKVESRIASLHFNPQRHDELLSTHENNTMSLWDYKSVESSWMKQTKQIVGALSRRVSQGILSPVDGSTLCTLGPEVMDFWSVFRKRDPFVAQTSSLSLPQIR